jgi:hypothetical protein
MKLVAAVLVSLASAALAADNGDLWEVTTQMNMAGMPGMGAQTRQVCTEKGDAKKAMTREDSKCKVTDFKDSGNRIQMTVQCPEGTGVMDTTFNSSRTEYKGTMNMTSKQGNMTMNMQGRKVGACDPAAAKAQQNAQAEQYKGQATAAMASAQQSYDAQAATCRQGAAEMQIQGLGIFSQCETTPGYCESMAQTPMTAGMAKVCMASAQDYCAKYKTPEGFLKAARDADTAAKMCKVDNAKLRSSFCAQAAKSDNLAFLGSQCPVEAKPIAQANCAGRSYTSQVRDKYTDFCKAYLSHATLEQPATPAAATPAPADAAKAAVNEGINKIKGLFGR